MKIHADYYPPSMNDGHHCFVFGSNQAGIHGAGAALRAKQYWGAIQYVGQGPSGASYAIPTKDALIKTLSLDEILIGVDEFIRHARRNPQTYFLVTRVGCGLAGYKAEQISPMFKTAPGNCLLPNGWRC